MRKKRISIDLEDKEVNTIRKIVAYRILTGNHKAKFKTAVETLVKLGIMKYQEIEKGFVDFLVRENLKSDDLSQNKG